MIYIQTRNIQIVCKRSQTIELPEDNFVIWFVYDQLYWLITGEICKENNVYKGVMSYIIRIIFLTTVYIL